MGFRILIIKLGAMGDVLRTTPLLRKLAQVHPKRHVTWITAEPSLPLLETNPLIDRLWPADPSAIARLHVERFDLSICLDKDPLATAMATQAQAGRKQGFAMSETGNAYPVNPGSEYTFALGLSDDLKFRRNRKTYQELIFECAGFEFSGEDYVLELEEADRAWAAGFCRDAGFRPDDIVVGLNTGAGRVFPTKRWHVESYADLARRLARERGAKVLLLGGEDEIERNAQIATLAAVPAVHSGGRHTVRQFAALLGRCSAVVTGDTLAMHLAIASKVPVVALFGPTCEQEVHLYGRGVKLDARVPCSPCYKHSCPYHMECMTGLTVDQVFEHTVAWLPKTPAATPATAPSAAAGRRAYHEA